MARRGTNRRFRSAGYWIIVIAVLCVLVVLERSGLLLSESARNDLQRYHEQTFNVIRVIDGDTLDIDIADPTTGKSFTRVRLWGIDSPELGFENRPGEPYSNAAKVRARELAQNEAVTLELEQHRLRGKYGRVLAHITFADGRVLNEIMVEEGLAEADDRWRHERLRAYDEAEQRARQARRGMWKK